MDVARRQRRRGVALVGGVGSFAVRNYRNLYNVYQSMRRNFRSGRTTSRFARNVGVGMKRRLPYTRGVKKIQQNRRNVRPRLPGTSLTGPGVSGGGGGNNNPVGFYQGRVRGVTRRSSAKKGSIYDVKGYRKETEQFGTATGTGGLVRLAVKAYPADDMLIGVFISVLRYLLKKHYGYVYTNPDAPINYRNDALGNAGRPARFIMRLAKDDAPGSRAIFSVGGVSGILIQGTTTIRDLATAVCASIMSLGLTSERDEYYPLDYTFDDQYQAGGAGVTGEAFNYFPFAGMRIALYGSAQVVIQNTSRHDTSTSAAIGFVDNNPVVGNICYLNGQTVDPKTIALGTSSVGGNELGMNFVTGNDGVIFADTVTGQMWKAVQGLSAFKRGVKQLSISLDPGASQQYNVFYKYNGLLSTFLMKYWPDSTTAVPGTVAHQGTASRYGGLNMIALLQLEKRLSTGGQPVSVNYHVDFHIGTRVVRGPSQPRWTVDYAERNVNDTAPAALMAPIDEKMEVGVDNVEE